MDCCDYHRANPGNDEHDCLDEEELAPNCCPYHKAGGTLRHDCTFRDHEPEPMSYPGNPGGDEL